MNREEVLDRVVYNIAKWSSIPEGYGFDHWLFDGCEFIHFMHDPITIDDWNRAKIVPNTKIRILSPDHSEYVQKLAFEVGFKWQDNHTGKAKHTYQYGLFVNGEKMTFATCLDEFDKKQSKEIFIELPSAQVELPETEKKYRRTVADINARVLAEKVGDMVSKPNHYQLLPEYEVKDVNKALLDKIQLSDFDLSLYEAGWYQQAMQYFMRFYAKNGLEDLEKGVQTMQFVIDSIKGRK